MRLLSLVLLLLWAGCRQASDGTVLRLGHGLDPSHPVHRAMVVMGEELHARSGGTMRLEIYPSQQLGTERECLELLQIGSLAMTKVSASVLENFAPSFQVMGLPFLFRSAAHRYAVWEGAVGRELLLASQAFRLRGLAYYDAGSRSFYTVDHPIETPADLAGLKIRTQESPTAIQMVNTLGGSATPISWGELYTALQQGVVDGAENNPPSFYLSRHYEVARFYSLNEHTAVPDVLVMSTKIWDDLTPQQQAWVQAAADASAEAQKQFWAAATAEALQAVQDAGVTVLRPDKAPFFAQVQPMLDAFRDDPTLGDLIQRILATPDTLAAPP